MAAMNELKALVTVQAVYEVVTKKAKAMPDRTRYRSATTDLERSEFISELQRYKKEFKRAVDRYKNAYDEYYIAVHDASSIEYKDEVHKYVEFESEIDRIMDEISDIEEEMSPDDRQNRRNEQTEREEEKRRQAEEAKQVHNSEERNDADQLRLRELEIQQEQRREAPTNATSYHLPNIPLRKFNGKVLEWKPFWDLFEAQIHNSALSNVIKYSYLLSLVDGDAKRLIDNYALTGDNYEKAIGLLQDRYGQKEDIIYAHYTAIIAIKPAYRPDQLRDFVSELECHLSQLEALGENVDNLHLLFTVLPKLPREVQEEMYMKRRASKWTVNELREHLRVLIRVQDTLADDEIHTRSKPQLKKSEPSYKGQQWKGEPPKPSSKMVAQSKPTIPVNTWNNAASQGRKKPSSPCPYCDENHWASECDRYISIEDRQRRLQELQLCWRCFSPGHKLTRCTVKRRCRFCPSTGHHSSLCPKNEVLEREQPEDTDSDM